MPAAAAILCEILAPHSSEAAALAEVAVAVARDLGQSLTPQTLQIGKTVQGPTLTLHLPMELAARQHEAWWLACQLTCFCPQAQISVLVLGANAFSPPQRNSLSA